MAPRSWSCRLRDVHDDLLDRVADVRDDTDVGPLADAVRAGCGLVCGRLTTHHTREDAALFPLLGDPALAETVDLLRRDHLAIAGLVTDLERAVAAGESGDRLVSRLDGLEAIMTSHFRFEGRTLGPALDALSALAALAATASDPDRLFGAD